MSSNINILQLFILVGAAQGILLSMVIVNKRRKTPQALLLVLALLALSIRLLVFPFIDVPLDTRLWSFVKNGSLLLLLLVGPSIFLFVRNHLYQRRLSRRDIFHLLPFLIYSVHLLFPVFRIWPCYSYATLWSAILYGTLSFILITLKCHRLLAFQMPMDSYPIRLYKLAVPLILFPVMIMNLVAYSRTFFGFHPATLPYLLLTFIFYRMGYKGMVEPSRFLNQLLSFPIQAENAAIVPAELTQLIQVVEKEKLYLDHDLNLQKLSDRTGLSRHTISELLNRHLGKSFNTFINQYRIDTVKAKLCSPQFDHLSIIGIAMESGFASKSSFNLLFKKYTGLTPSEFKNQGRT